MPDELKPEPGFENGSPGKPFPETDFAAHFREGEAMAREWIAGRGDLPDLASIVCDMPRDLGGLEAGFLSRIDAAVRGARRGAAGAPATAKAQPSPEAPPAPPMINIDEFMQRRRELARRALLERIARHNDEAWREQAEMSSRGDANWRGW